MERHGIIILNGSGEAGKDTFIKFFCRNCPGMRVRRISTIDPVQTAMRLHLGWDGETKDKAHRRMMHEIKKSWSKNLDGPFKYVLNLVTFDMERRLRLGYGEDTVHFILAREPEEITKMVKMYNKVVPVTTVLIKRRRNEKYGNSSDDNVTDYTYDKVIRNDSDLDTFEDRTRSFIDSFKTYGVSRITQETLEYLKELYAEWLDDEHE